MRFRLFICLMGGLLLPTTGRALLVSDLPGTFQAMTEAGNTLNNWKESVNQASAIQKTVSAVGTAKNGISNTMNSIKDFKERAEHYKEQVAQAKEDIERYKQQAAQAKEDIKEAADTIKNADEIGKNWANGAINSAKDTANGAINSAKGTIDSAKDTVGIKNTDDSGREAESKFDKPNENDFAADGGGSSGTRAAAADIVDTPSARPSRKAIGRGPLSSVSSVSGGKAISAGGPVTLSSGGMVQGATSAAPVSAAGTVRQAVTTQAVDMIDAPRSPAEAIPVMRMPEAEQDVKTLKSAAEIEEVSGVRANSAEKLKTLTPPDQGLLLKTQDVLPAENVSASKTIKNGLHKADFEKAAKVEAGEIKLKENKKNLSAPLKVNARKTLPPAKQTDEQNIKQAIPQVEREKNIRPVRASFKTSAGYGQIKTSAPLAFAQMETNLKGGTAMGNIMIVPRNIFIRCQLDYEQAAEKDKFDKCLKKINDIRMSKISDETTKGMIDEAVDDLYNGYAEMLASGFLEAFEVYNDSVDFYFKQIHPNQEVNNQRAADVSEGWALAKDMNRLLDDRLNEMNKLFARQLLIKGFESYINFGIKTFADPINAKTPLNTNMYDKVIISSVLIDRCGISVTEPVIDEDCLKILAKDMNTDAEGTNFDNWNEERGLIINEYASAYNQVAAKILAETGNNIQKIADLTKTDLSDDSPLEEPDILKKITDNNAIANEVSAKILNALDLRGSSILLDNINKMLTELVPNIKTDNPAS